MASPSPKPQPAPPIYLPTTSLSLSYISISLALQISSSPPMASKTQSCFEDFFPIMTNKLGGDGLIGELCNGFRLLMDADKGLITFDSLKKNAAVLGLQDLTDNDLRNMVREGDLDGDGALNQMEFCVLMFRLSPDLMEQSQFLLEEALHQELKGSQRANKTLNTREAFYIELLRL
ncbi:calcium-binding protein PBP1-like [Actinidia eriantha]|uniref:calcium-binding protein PBP1-like n=1 Tax=Actinidia eriantha TaxID=165200 RepID=UPI00258ABBBA|nr:calcium-binding protein PBP1-like [Actinidia eriantha]XP_057465211.1 calcium-binding protein PBP1-like [Actinidia eriantha]